MDTLQVTTGYVDYVAFARCGQYRALFRDFDTEWQFLSELLSPGEWVTMFSADVPTPIYTAITDKARTYQWRD